MAAHVDRARATTSNPATVAEPAVGSASVQSILIVVDLPAPLGPRKPKISPGATSKEIAVDGGERAVALDEPVDVDRRRRSPTVAVDRAGVDTCNVESLILDHDMLVGSCSRQPPIAPTTSSASAFGLAGRSAPGVPRSDGGETWAVDAQPAPRMLRRAARRRRRRRADVPARRGQRERASMRATSSTSSTGWNGPVSCAAARHDRDRRRNVLESSRRRARGDGALRGRCRGGSTQR